MRQHLFAANWKMYKTPEESTTFIDTIKPLLPPDTRAEVAVFPSTTSLPATVAAAKGTQHRRRRAEHALARCRRLHRRNLAHHAPRPRRHPRPHRPLRAPPVLQRDRRDRQPQAQGRPRPLASSPSSASASISPSASPARPPTSSIARSPAPSTASTPPTPRAIVFAYEPVWAIGTGRTATPEIAEDAHKIIRSIIADTLGSDLAQTTRILYGGSVKPDNARSLCCLDDVDGALVGGASLDPASFADIVKNAVGSR